MSITNEQQKGVSERMIVMDVSDTYVSLDVEVLEVERVLPDVDADDGDVRCKKV